MYPCWEKNKVYSLRASFSLSQVLGITLQVGDSLTSNFLLLFYLDKINIMHKVDVGYHVSSHSIIQDLVYKMN